MTHPPSGHRGQSTVPHIRIYISSPKDVPGERQLAGRVIERLAKDPEYRNALKLDPILWDDPEAKAPMVAQLTPQESANRALARPSDCDIVVTIFWSRMGTPLETPLKADGTPYLSGTEWEFEDAMHGAREAGRDVLPFRCTRELMVSLKDPEFAEKKRQSDLVDAFFDRFTGPGGGQSSGYTPYETASEFETLLEQSLRSLLTSRKQVRVNRARPKPREKPREHPGPTRAPIVPAAYRDWLKKETGSLELLGLGGAHGRSLFLSSVYVPLVTTRSGERDVAIGPRKHTDLLLDAFGKRSLYVPGGPGFGKSTFCSWVAWLMCQGAIPQADVEPPDEFVETLPKSLREKLPVLVRLREFWEALPMKPAGSALTANELSRVLQDWLHHRVPAAADVDLASFIDYGKAVLLFDGVDEVPTTHATPNGECSPRHLLLGALSRAVANWTPNGNVVLVTSRPYGLTDGEIKRLGLEQRAIADVPRELQTLLARRWFRIQKQDAVKGDASATDLMRDIGEREWLQPLAANPLMLSAMCAIYGDGGKLPQDRHQLYANIVDSVLTKRYPDTKRRGRVRFELCAIAHAMHTGDGIGVQYLEPMPQATVDEATLALRRDHAAASQKEHVLGPKEALQDLLTQSGLLTGSGDERLAFYHLSIQEFLAAERIFDLDLDDLAGVFIDRAQGGNWRNTLAFLFGRYMATFSVATRPIALLNQLVVGVSKETPGLQLVAADCAEMLAAKGYALDDEPGRRLREALLDAMTRRPAPRERCEAGTALGRIGDPRFRKDWWFLPAERDAPLGFLRVDAGRFLMGTDRARDKTVSVELLPETPQHSVDLPEFYIARSPVTVAQFRAFVDDSGISSGNPDCLRGVSNHPVVSVSWSEAVAYCEWLTGKLRSWTTAPDEIGHWLEATVRRGWRVTLPSEAEWERAARGTNGRIYPWGDEFDPSFANGDETGIGRTSAVGAFPAGGSPVGALDMCGNVWERTRSLSKPYPYDPADDRETMTAESWLVLRGGSFFFDADILRAAFRYRNGAQGRDENIGFRVVCSRSRS